MSNVVSYYDEDRNGRRSFRRKSPKKRILTPGALLKSVMGAGIAGLMVLRLLPDGALAAKSLAQPGDTCRVVSVIDGDTVAMWCPAKGVERARLIGLDTPEIFSPKCASELKQGRVAAMALRRYLLDAQSVSIVKEGKDQYGRALVKIWADGAALSRRMIADGHARAYAGGKRDGWCL